MRQLFVKAANQKVKGFSRVAWIPICLRRTNILNLGDYNADLFFQRGLQTGTSQGKKLLRILHSFNLHDIIDQATRITETSETIVDLIITSISS